MNKEEAFLAGKIVKSPGIKGELMIALNLPWESLAEKADFLWIDLNNRLIPFYVVEISGEGKNVWVSLEDICNPETAKPLIKRDVYLSIDKIPKQFRKSINPGIIEGYKVSDITYGEIGVVKEVIAGTVQDIILISGKTHEIMIPVAEDIILGMDNNKKTITINAPEGLIDLNKP
ncbi:MAG: ribosome maturation factor RimM [Bacteroidetes bacterium]|nr:ribosome maturation factor RimM [Bacteroidota bacterium]